MSIVRVSRGGGPPRATPEELYAAMRAAYDFGATCRTMVAGSVSHSQQPDVGSLAPSNTEGRATAVSGGGWVRQRPRRWNPTTRTPKAESGTPAKREASHCRARRAAVLYCPLNDGYINTGLARWDSRSGTSPS